VYECAINPITNPNPVNNHTQSRDNMDITVVVMANGDRFLKLCSQANFPERLTLSASVLINRKQFRRRTGLQREQKPDGLCLYLSGQPGLAFPTT
jgi:hypothetical protein